MTREQAIKWLKAYIQDTPFQMEQYERAFEMAIQALSQEPREDCISRQAVLYGLASIAKAKAKSDAQKSLMGRVMFFTEHLPSVTQKSGMWIGIDKFPCSEWKCSECNENIHVADNPYDYFKYCPNCGAKMESEVKTE